jgi:hypothetical protein
MRIAIKNISKQIKRLVIKAILFCSATATAAIPPMVYPVVEPSGPSKPLDLENIAKLELMFQNETDFDISHYIPAKDLRPDMTGEDFAEVVLKNSIERFIETRSANSTWRAVDRAANGFASEAVKISAGGTSHTFKFRVNPFESETKIVYRGLANASVSYDLDDEILKLEVSEQVGFATVVAAHVTSQSERTDTLGVRWEF